MVLSVRPVMQKTFPCHDVSIGWYWDGHMVSYCSVFTVGIGQGASLAVILL